MIGRAESVEGICGYGNSPIPPPSFHHSTVAFICPTGRCSTSCVVAPLFGRLPSGLASPRLLHRPGKSASPTKHILYFSQKCPPPDATTAACTGRAIASRAGSISPRPEDAATGTGAASPTVILILAAVVPVGIHRPTSPPARTCRKTILIPAIVIRQAPIRPRRPRRQPAGSSSSRSRRRRRPIPARTAPIIPTWRASSPPRRRWTTRVGGASRARRSSYWPASA